MRGPGPAGTGIADRVRAYAPQALEMTVGQSGCANGMDASVIQAHDACPPVAHAPTTGHHWARNERQKRALTR